MSNHDAFSLWTELDVYLFRAGKHFKLYEKFGAHEAVVDGENGIYFSVWAPNAKEVSVIGNFNNWKHSKNFLTGRWDQSGIWETFIPKLKISDVYKYSIKTQKNEFLEKSDPFAVKMEQAMQAGSVIASTWYAWHDEKWLLKRQHIPVMKTPISVYEMHLGSWRKNKNNPDEFLTYREIASELIPYVKEMGFSHVEFMPVMEYPYDPSWGYQITGFYAASSRFGAPTDLMFLIDQLHQNDIGVILDWVPSHFPGDANGLHRFDSSFLYEHEDPRKGFHPDWKSYIFNYGRPEVKSFLISNAMFWLDRYHADGLRVDAVTSMLHLDYSRNDGEWEPNIHGGNVNLEAKSFLQDFNLAVHKNFPDVVTIAEESSDFPKLTKSVSEDGIGFDMKWMMGWMHDTLDYFKKDPVYRKFHQDLVTFTSLYMFNENYMMPLSHDEVVHGKSSLIYKMAGDEWQKYANLRALYLYMFTNPGAKLLFMGSEFAQTNEWNFETQLDWDLLKYPIHAQLQLFVKELNKIYSREKALFELNFDKHGFEWVNGDDRDHSIFIYLRKGKSKSEKLMIILNLTPNSMDYQVGVDDKKWKILLNSDDKKFGGSGIIPNINKILSKKLMGRAYTMDLRLPPLSGLILKNEH
ncbi:1,4-alpha-glucan branching enzyme [Soonwooa buanensis]|uniref:1,4-alpha-glucan branching enzyme GlgB n=1 Tax=Soonwooa buanensis TaxID=619805 RepID=A0A1T5DRR0_9FLAO|nr:1,4-alpha-glucan branching protein GlgB [Soonwooa buanensis]SKB74361.1 1,4-alpha-glucan branching enzyme [Soonwooa buanensis]